MVVFPLTQRYSTLPSTISQALATQAKRYVGGQKHSFSEISEIKNL